MEVLLIVIDDQVFDLFFFDSEQRLDWEQRVFSKQFEEVVCDIFHDCIQTSVLRLFTGEGVVQNFAEGNEELHLEENPVSSTVFQHSFEESRYVLVDLRTVFFEAA